MDGFYDIANVYNKDQKPDVPEGKFCIWHNKTTGQTLLLAKINGEEKGVELG